MRLAFCACLAATAALCGQAFASESKTYDFSGKPVSLTELPEARALISSSCVRGERIESCDASKLMMRASFRKYHVTKGGGVEPGAALCRKLGAKVVYGLDELKNQVSFCRGKDGTLLSTDALHYHARANDEQGDGHE